MRRALVVVTSGLVVAVGLSHAQERPRRFITLSGAVVDSAIRPVPGALVYLSSARIFSFTDETGKFALDGVEPGLDTLQLRARGFEPSAFRLLLPDSVPDSLDIGPVPLKPGPLPALSLSFTLRDTLRGRPVADAEVVVNGRKVGETDGSGAFAKTGIPAEWGINTVLLRQVGYAPVILPLWVDAVDTRRTFDGVMQQLAVDMPAVVVEADRILFSYGRMKDFLLRRQRGFGWFMTQDEIERRNASRVSDLLRMVPGILVSFSGLTPYVRTSRGCSPSLWIDGFPVLDGSLELDMLVRPQDLAGIEVYSRLGEVPLQFLRGFNACGAIVVWTR